MKLSELNPKFIVLEEGGDEVGMSFRCPHCPPGERGETTYLGIWFADPVPMENHPHVDWPHYMLDHPTEHFWQRTGVDWDSITIMPSVDASHVGHWHGFITAGEVR